MVAKNSETAPKGTVNILNRLQARGKIPGSRGGTKLSKFLARKEEIRQALAAGIR